MRYGSWIPMDDYNGKPLPWRYRSAVDSLHAFVEVDVPGVGSRAPVKLMPGGIEATAHFVIGEILKAHRLT
jgi:hypothetical protein